jgi:uncharacterized protein (TIGR03118 family)
MLRLRYAGQWVAWFSFMSGLAIVLESGGLARADVVAVKNLVTNDQAANPAQITDGHLQNAWGISSSPTSPFWVSANGAGLAVLYSVNPVTEATSKVGLEVTIPGAGSVTGQVFNGNAAGGAFNADNFLFVSEDGTISGWRGALGTTAEVLQLSSAANVYKGTAFETIIGNSYLLSANFRAGTIDVYKGSPGAPDLAGKFVDPGIPSGYAPFNIQNLGGTIYVTYALQDGAKHDDVAGAGHGFVSKFDAQGNFMGRVATMGPLNSPWGLAIAPSSFGSFAGDLLVGNFGDGRINAFTPAGTFVGQLPGLNGSPLSIDGLWALTPGNGGSGGNASVIYFSAGPQDESNGLFGALVSIPEPGPVVLGLLMSALTAAGLRWRTRSAAREA